MRWAILNADKTKVYNVIEAEENFVNQHYPDAILVTEGVAVGPDYLHQDGIFTEPVRVMPEDIIDVEEVISTPALESPTE